MLFVNPMLKGIVILGPTASGKSELACALAQRVNGSVICADSLQIYEGLALLTAQPTEDEKREIPHYLYEYFDLKAPRSSAAAWRGLAIEAVEKILRTGRTPIFVGGTGFYIKALLEGLSPIPNVSSHTMEMLESLKTSELAKKLNKEDPVMAARIEPRDRQRMVRALSVLRDTGESLSFWQNSANLGERKSFCVVSLCPDISVLDRRLRERFDAMARRGVTSEAEKFARSFWGKCIKGLPCLVTKGLAPKTSEIVRMLTPFYPQPWPPITRAIGFAEILMALGGGLSFEEARDLVILRTRQYAKRQRTWLRHQVNIDIRLESPDIEYLMHIFKMI